MQEQQSNNNHSYQPAPLQRQESEAKVGKKDKKDKPKRTKEEKEQRKIEKEQRRQRKAEKAARNRDRDGISLNWKVFLMSIG